MFRIRFHGRGGQGMKMASHILGTAFFLAGFEVQDAPRFGAERRGAPIFAYVRAEKKPIKERGIISYPGLILVADESLVPLPVAGILSGVDKKSVLFLNSRENSITWKERLNFPGSVLAMDLIGGDLNVPGGQRFFGAICAGAAAALVGVISKEILLRAIEAEVIHVQDDVVEENKTRALAAYEVMQKYRGIVKEGGGRKADQFEKPEWIEVPLDMADISAPVIHGRRTSELMKTGSWRLRRPVIDYSRCKGCWWVCSTFCPDSAIYAKDGKPHIDYDHCKGCMICMVQCSAHAISLVAEFQAEEANASE
jgi:pyruvate ferredoxin oxidoreductase gamma subunit